MPRKRRLRPNWPLLTAILVTIIAMGAFVAWRSALRLKDRGFSASSWKLAVVESSVEAVTAAWFLATGASIGSFLNVVAWRSPRRMSLLIPSRCPYCHTSLSFTDNFPVFGWLNLRGRCRTCRLSIDARYICVELLLLAVFGWTFLNEYLTLGRNLPSQPFTQSMLLEDRLVNTPFGLQILIYLWVESGLIVMALMTLQNSKIPWQTFLGTALPSVLLPIAVPGMILVPWRGAVIESIVQQRIEGCLTILCGIAMGWVVGWAVAWLATLMHQQLVPDVPLVESGIHQQRTISAGFAVAGGLLGWQAMIVVAVLTLVLAWLVRILIISRFFPGALQSWRQNVNLIASVSTWLWLAVLIYRSTWIYWVSAFGTPIAAG